MVINESPDGFALMHMSGHTHRLRVGDIVALQAAGKYPDATPPWHVCIVRWALSENPEHIELGLQLMSTQAAAVKVAQPQARSGFVNGLILPEAPPLRLTQSLIVPAGALKEDKSTIVVLCEKDHLAIREVRATELIEQTSSVEVFSIIPDATA